LPSQVSRNGRIRNPRSDGRAAARPASIGRPRTVRETDLYEMLAIIPARGHGRVSLPLVYPLNGTYSVPEYGGGLAAVTLRP
jgi:hypothetical protein